MKNPTAILVSAIVAVSTFALGTPSASADLSSPQFRLKAVMGAQHFEDVGREGESFGDTFTFTEKLFHAGERVGRDAVTCQITKARPSAFRLLCWGTLTLWGHGDLTIHGKVTFRRGSSALPVLAVTGGTGDYTGASGTMTIQESPRTTRYLVSLVP